MLISVQRLCMAEKRWKQQSKRWKNQPAWITYSRISPNRKRSHDRHPDLSLQQDLEDRRMADHMDSLPSYHTPQKGNLQLCQNYRTISLISHPSKVMLKTPVTSRRDHCRRTCKFQSRKEHHRTNIQSQDPLWEIPAASAESLPCLHRLQEGPWQGMVRNLMGNCEEIQQQRQPHTSHWKSVWQGPECNHL